MYDGDGVAGDRAQEPCGAWVQGHVEQLECMAGLQQYLEVLKITC